MADEAFDPIFVPAGPEPGMPPVQAAIRARTEEAMSKINDAIGRQKLAPEPSAQLGKANYPNDNGPGDDAEDGDEDEDFDDDVTPVVVHEYGGEG